MILIQTIGSFFAVLTVSVFLSVPRKFLIKTGIAGAVGWFIYLILHEYGRSVPISMFAASLAVALISHSFARIFKAPVTVFLIPGILPLVPGVGMYRMVYFLIIQDPPMLSYYFIQTLQIAGMIALAIFIMDTVFRTFHKKQKTINLPGIEETNANVGIYTETITSSEINTGSSVGSNSDVRSSSSIGSSLDVGTSSSIGSNSDVGSSSSIGSSLDVGSSSSIGSNSDVGSSSSIGSSSDVGSSSSIGSSSDVGSNSDVSRN